MSFRSRWDSGSSVSIALFSYLSKERKQPFASNFCHITRRNPSIQQRVHRGVKSTNDAPSRQIDPSQRTRNHRHIRIKTRALCIPRILDSSYVPFKAHIAMQGVEDMRGETADVGGGYMGAFRDFEGIEGDEVDSIDVVAFQGRENMTIGFR